MPPSTPLDERFWAFVDIRAEDECWPWTGGTDGPGYGKLGEGGRAGRTLRAHRVCWEMCFGEIPEGKAVGWTCGNIICMNPSHLKLQTRQEISDKMKAEGKQKGGSKSPRRGSDSNFAVLSEDDVKAIKILLNTGEYSQAQVAHMFNITRPLVSMIATGKRWGHVTL